MSASQNDDSHERALERIEEALQIAFRGEAGTQRLTRIIKALDRRPPALSDDMGLREHLAAAIAEIDLLRERARRGNVPMDSWLAAVAEDIGATVPAPDNMALETVFSLIGRMSAYPARALCAQAGVPRATVRILTE